jgi:hypothetical protein
MVWIRRRELSRPPRLTTDLTLRLSPVPCTLPISLLILHSFPSPATKGTVPSHLVSRRDIGRLGSDIIYSRAQWGSRRTASADSYCPFYAWSIVLTLSASVGEFCSLLSTLLISFLPYAMACRHASLDRHDAAQEIHCAGHAASNIVLQIHVATPHRARALRFFLVRVRLHTPRQSRLAAAVD